MDLIRSKPQTPLPLGTVLLSCFLLWIAPVGLGLIGLALAVAVGRLWAEPGLELWFIASTLIFSPLYSWIGWLIALPTVILALWQGWFGWATALLIGAGSGLVAGALADTEIALPFGIVALLVLRAVLGQIMPLRRSS
jgi:hypothetical protein